VADDRGIVTFEHEAQITARAAAFKALIREWIQRLP
jgi:hypothetical protein